MNAPGQKALFQADATQCVDSRFVVPGIKCAGCIGKIENGLAKIPDIAAARVNFSNKTVAVSHLPALDEDQVRQQIEALGFKAQILADNPLADDSIETRQLIRALAVAGFGMMNIMLLSVSIWAGAGGATRDLFHGLSALIAIPVIAYSGRPFFASAAMALRYGRTNMDVPISIGVLLATGLSLYETITGGAHAYFDGAVMLLFFLLAGRVLDGMMRGRAREGITALLKRSASGAMVVQEDGTTRWTNARDLSPGMLVHVAAGETLAADAVIESGESRFDLSMLTGESVPQPRTKGDAVFAGSLNVSQQVTVRVTAAAQDSAIADMARLMDEAGQHRSRFVRIADRAARFYAPVVHSLALLAFAGWMVAGAGVHLSLLIAVAVLIITCPCALALAVPVAQVVACGALMKHGMLIKDGSALERLAEIDRVVFDKTGTLTLGRPNPTNLDSIGEEPRAIALSLAQASRHPLSQGLREALIAAGTMPAALEDIEEEAGWGLRARLGERQVSLGRADTGDTEMAVALTIGSDRYVLTLADSIRPDAAQTISRLQPLVRQMSILSGDRVEAVGPVARELGLFAQTEASPADKVATVKRLSANGEKVLMVGDGLNDGPALAAAHAAIAPGSASDVGQQAADAVFTSDSLTPIVLAIETARRTQRIVRQNFALAIGYNICAVPLALAGLVTPLIAAVAMSLSSLIVIGNALRLRTAAQ